MFFPKFVGGCSLSRIPLLPERFNKKLTLSIRIKLEKNICFERCDDVNDFFLEPFFKDGRKVFRRLFLGNC
jgi:hypothetical protein